MGMSRRLMRMVLGFSSFRAEKHYCVVEVRLLKFLWRYQTQKKNERTFIKCWPVLGIMPGDFTHIFWFQWSYWALVSQAFSIYKKVDENNGGYNHRMTYHAVFKGHVFEECLMVEENIHQLFCSLKSRLWNNIYTMDPKCTLEQTCICIEKRMENYIRILTYYF